ncbi:MAG: LuxR C-terminal-related transcriptional regulator, partial [Dehalococcoidia bacterium]|nr:LuxR C-terminal-related transcriptional regulator [Dehalococcoidia bacterium]
VAEAHIRTGLASLVLVGKDKPSRELIDLHSARFQICHRRGDAEGMAETATEILSLAKLSASPRAEAEANFVASISSLLANDVNGALERALHALEIAEEAQELATSCRLYGWLVDIGMRLGDHQFMRRYAERGLIQVQRLGVPSSEVILRSRLAYASFMSGAWDESLRCTSEAIALARRVGHPRDMANSLATRAMILALQGNTPEAEACISEARAAFGNPPTDGPIDRYVRGLVDLTEVSLSLEGGQVEHALEIARSFVGPPATPTDPFRLAPPFLPIGLALLAEAQLAAGDAEGALDTAHNIADLGPTGNLYSIALASLCEGLARKGLGPQEMAIDCLTRAHDIFTALEMPYEAARSLLELAQIKGEGSGDAEHPLTPVQAAGQSLATFESLGARRHAERARQVLADLGISPRASQQSRLGGVSVSPRELEIARLIAAGHTSDEIAKRLTLSPRTVDSHLRRIYTRLGINSRMALARLVFDAGLL